MKLEALKKRLNQEKGQLQRIESELYSSNSALELLEKRKESSLKAREVLRTVALQTQQQLEFHIGGLVSSALSAVFDDPPEFRVIFEQKRNKTECRLVFVKDDEEMNPLQSSGGGPIDVASFALRLAFLQMERPASRRTLILDEPFKFVSVDFQSRCSSMVRELSSKLGLQVIMVSHLPEIIDSADKVFEVSMREGKSGVKEI